MTVADAGPATVEPRRRLHPLSPLLHSAKTLAVIMAAISIQGFARLGLAGSAGVLLLVLLGAMALSAVSWLMTGYHVVGRELRIHEGLLWRRTRAIPLERLQAVDLVRPAVARVAGLAELRLEVIGAAKAEAPLAYLSMADAIALRTRLLALAAGPAAATAPGGAGGPGVDHPEPGWADPTWPAPDRPAAGWPTAGGPAAGWPTMGWPGAGGAGQPAMVLPPAPAERPIHRVANEDVLVSQLLTAPVWFVPFGMLFVVLQFSFDGSRTFVGIASTLTALIGVVVQPIRRALDDWNFRIATDRAGLRLRHGALSTRSQTVPLSRVQAIGITWPLLWRPKRWLRCRIDVAGYGRQDRDQAGQSDRLLPVSDPQTARTVVAEVLPGVDIAALALTPPPPRARWLAPIRQPVLGVALTGQVIATQDGPLTRELVIVPYARIQSVRVVQGPLQRCFRLATVYADTAGGLRAVAHHRDLAQCWAIAAELAARAREARAQL